MPDPAENEFKGSFTGTFERTGNRCVRDFKIPWDEYHDHVIYYLGYAELIDNVIRRHLPVRDYQHRGMIATRCEVRGIAMSTEGADEFDQEPLTSANKYQWAHIRVYFETPRFELGDYASPVDPDDPTADAPPNPETRRYCIKEVRAARELITAAPGQFVWANDAGDPSTNAVQTELPVITTFQDITVTWFDVPYDAVPVTALNNCQGKINQSMTELPNRPPPAQYDPFTLLLQSFTLTDIFFPDDTRAANITTFFKWRPQGFNNILTPRGDYRKIFRKATTGGAAVDYKNLYDSADFERLWKPEDA